VTDTPNHLMQQLWQEQPVEGTRMSIDEIRRRASRFEKRMLRLNMREFVAGGLGIALLGYFLSRAHDSLSRWGFALLIAGEAYALFHLYWKGRPGTASERVGTQCAEFFLEELERTKKLISNLWWYLGPLVPGLLVSTVGSALAHPQPGVMIRLAIVNLAIAAGFIFVIRLNTRAARCLQKQIDEIRTAAETH
jgi:hypothetical protein